MLEYFLKGGLAIMQAHVQSVAGDTSKIPAAKFQVGTMVRLKDDVEQLRIAQYQQHGHTQKEICNDSLLSHLQKGMLVIGVEVLSNPVADLTSAAAEDCYYGLRFRLPPNQIRAFPEWQFEVYPGQ